MAGARNVFMLDEEACCLVLHMGWQDSSIAVLQGSSAKYIGQIPFGMERIVRALYGNKALSWDDLKARFSSGLKAGPHMEAYVREVLIALSRLNMEMGRMNLIPCGYACFITDLKDAFRESFDLSMELAAFKGIQGETGRGDILSHFMPLALACRGIDHIDQVNFRKNDLAYTKKMEQMRGAAGTWTKVAAVFALVWLFGLGLNITLNTLNNTKLTKLIAKEFSSVMPPGTPMREPVKQMEQQLGKMTAGSSDGGSGNGETPLRIMKDVSTSIPANLDVLVDSILIEEDSLTITGTAVSYDTVEKIKESLMTLSYIAEVKIVSANVDKKDQRVRLKLVCSRKSNSSGNT